MLHVAAHGVGGDVEGVVLGRVGRVVTRLHFKGIEAPPDERQLWNEQPVDVIHHAPRLETYDRKGHGELDRVKASVVLVYVTNIKLIVERFMIEGCSSSLKY